jgi:hypothetical protein
MVNKEFDDFVARQMPKEKESKVDWTKQRKEWLVHLSDFYLKVEEFLSDYVVKGQIAINLGVKSIIEEGLGEYEVKTATIKIGTSEIKLEPIGTNVIGAKGRIDMTGSNGTVRFVLVEQDASEPRTSVQIWTGGKKPSPKQLAKPKKVKLAWKISTPPPQIKYIELNPESFFESVMAVANG